MSVNNEEIESDMIHIRGPKKREECKIMRISLRLNDEEKREEQVHHRSN